MSFIDAFLAGIGIGRGASVETRSLSVALIGEESFRRLREAEAFYREIRPWLIAREEDAVLIVPPNRVYKLGGSGNDLLRHLDGGGSLSAVPGLDEARAREILRFFDEIRAAYEGLPTELGRVSYDFSFTRLPVLGELALTYRCNERCRFCYAACGETQEKAFSDCRSSNAVAMPQASAAIAPGASDSGAAAGELSFEEAKRIILAFKEEAKIPFFSFTGGEPLLRSDLEELAAYATSLGLRINLITNGSLATPARAAALKSAGFDTAQVSLESPEAAIHDELCGVSGAFERTTAGIRALREAGISVQTNATITRYNAQSLLDLPDFLVTLGVTRFSANLFIPSGRGLQNSELFVAYTEIGPIVDAIRKNAKTAGLTFFWYSPTPYCLYNPVARGLGNKSCAACDGLVHVNPHGEILPCSSWPEPLGSMLDTSFREIWFSERAASIKRKAEAPAFCVECPSFVACQGACPLYWSAIGEGELEGARRECARSPREST